TLASRRKLPPAWGRHVRCNQGVAMRYTSAILFAFCAGLGGCGPEVHLTDDIDLTWDFGITLKRFDGTLHTPYVKGAPVTMYVNAGEKDDLTGWKISSSDASVFEISS